MMEKRRSLHSRPNNGWQIIEREYNEIEWILQKKFQRLDGEAWNESAQTIPDGLWLLGFLYSIPRIPSKVKGNTCNPDEWKNIPSENINSRLPQKKSLKILSLMKFLGAPFCHNYSRSETILALRTYSKFHGQKITEKENFCGFSSSAQCGFLFCPNPPN